MEGEFCGPEGEDYQCFKCGGGTCQINNGPKCKRDCGECVLGTCFVSSDNVGNECGYAGDSKSCMKCTEDDCENADGDTCGDDDSMTCQHGSCGNWPPGSSSSSTIQDYNDPFGTSSSTIQDYNDPFSTSSSTIP